MKPEALEQAKRAFAIEAEEIMRTLSVMEDRAFERAVELLAGAGRIAASGCGHSGIACRHFTHLMCCIERPARFLSPSEAAHGASGFLQAGDVLLLVSRGGKTAELVPIAGIARQRGAYILLVTQATDSPLAAMADVVLPICVFRETDLYNSQGTSSFAATNALFDALQAALIVETGYRNEQFALVHPGGAVGQRLNGGKS